MDEYKPKNAHTDSDSDDYLSMLQEMQNSLVEESTAESSLTADRFASETELTADEFPLTSNLLVADALTPPMLQEPEFDNLYAATGELTLNGNHEASSSAWTVMPTQPLVLPSNYFEGSGFASFNETEKSDEQPSVSAALGNETSEPSVDSLTAEVSNFDRDEDLFAEMSREMPTAFALAEEMEDLDKTAPLTFVPPVEFEETVSDNDFFASPSEVAAVGQVPEIVEREEPAAIAEAEFGEIDAPMMLDETDDFDLPATMLLEQPFAAPEPDLTGEILIDEEPFIAPTFLRAENNDAPATATDEILSAPAVLDTDEAAAAPPLFESPVAETIDEPMFEDDFALPESNFLTSGQFDGLSNESVPEPTFFFESNDEIFDAPEIVTSAENETPVMNSPAAPTDFVSETTDDLSMDFSFSEDSEVLETPAPPVALRGISVEEEELPQPATFDEFPSYISDEENAVSENGNGEFPEHLDLNDAEDGGAVKTATPLSAFQPHEAQAALPNDFSQNGKHDYPAGVAQQHAAEAKNGTEAAVKTRSESGSFLEDRYIVFKIEEVLYAFSAKSIVEIGQPLPVTSLPFVPSWFLGISNLRGDILSVVGLRELWNRKSASSQQRTKLLVLRSEKLNVTVGLVVDGVREMRRLSSSEINQENAGETHVAAYQIGEAEYEGQRLTLLDAEKFLESLKG